MTTTMTVLVCLDGFRVEAVLDAASRTLAAGGEWLILHVSDARAVAEAERALGGLPGREPGRHHAERHLHHTVEWSEADVQAAVAAWLAGTGQRAEVLLARGAPAQEIIRVAEARGVDVIVLGGGRRLAGRRPGPGPSPLSPVARYVVDHARCDVLLLR